MKKRIFISYSWKDDFIVNRICDDLEFLGFDVIRDKKEVHYTDSISQYMKRIRTEDFVLLLLSDNFLKSVNCMKEIIEFEKDDRWDILLPVNLLNTDIYSNNRIKYIKYWENELNIKEALLREVDPCNAALEFHELQTDRIIVQNLANFLIKLKDRLLCSPKELWRNQYDVILKKTKYICGKKSLPILKNISNNEFEHIIKTHSDTNLADFSYHNLSNKTISNQTELNCINFRCANFRNTYLINTDFTSCDLTWGDFRGAKMKFVSFCNADLRGADLTGVKFDSIKVRGANFSYALMDEKLKDYVKAHGGTVDNEI